VDERKQVFLASVLGAAVGGVCGWLYLTERGREVKSELDPFFDKVVDEIHQAQHTVGKARLAVVEGKGAIDEVLRATTYQSES
jgi:hypothetical protein